MVSIIVPVYNTAKVLKRSVDSLCAQTYEDIEIILVDDGSKDSSGDICDELARSDDRIKVLHTANGGPGSARNAGLEVAGGEYVMFIDSDDYVDKRFVEIPVREAEAKRLDIVFCNYRFVNEAGDAIDNECYSSFSSTEVFDGVQALKLFENRAYRTYFDVVWNKLYRSELFNGIRFPEKTFVGEDIAILPQLYYRANRITAVNDILYYYSCRDDSLSHTHMSAAEDIQYRGPVLEDRLNLYIERDIKELVLIHIIHLYSAYRAVIRSGYETPELKRRMRELQQLYRSKFKAGKYYDRQNWKQRLKFVLAAGSLDLYDHLARG